MDLSEVFALIRREFPAVKLGSVEHDRTVVSIGDVTHTYDNRDLAGWTKEEIVRRIRADVGG